MGQQAGLVFHEDRETCLRPVRKLPKLASSSRLSGSFVPDSPIDVTPPSPSRHDRRIIGYVFSSRVTRTSTTTGPSVSIAPSYPAQAFSCSSSAFPLRRRPPRASRSRGIRPCRRGCICRPEKLLPLADHPQIAVVHDEHLDRDLVLRAGRKLLRVHLHRAIARDTAHQAIGTAHRRAHRRRQAKAHRAEATELIQRRGAGKS